MQTRLKMSREGLELLKEFEGLRLTAARLSDGRWTMGHGHIQYAREGATITAGDAEALLIYDLIPVAAAVNDSVVPQISQSQFDALVCFAFNVGIDAFKQSEVLQRVNQERMTEAALAMAIWRAGAFNGRRVVLDALVRRRSAEEALMLGRDGRQSPSNLVRPEIDPEAQASLPNVPPARLDATFDGERAGVQLVEAPEQEGPSGTEEPEVGVDEVSGVEPAASTVEPTEPVVAEDPAGEVAPLPVQVPTGEAVTPAMSEAPAEPTLPEVSVSTRIYSSVPATPFSPLNAARPEADMATVESVPADDETTGLMDPPAAGTQVDEPPLVLILTPPPEVAAEAAPSAAEFSPAPEPIITSEAEAPLFEQGGPEAMTAQGEPVIYYQPEDDDADRTAGWSDTGAYVATGIVGLAAFGFGIAGFQLAGQESLPVGTFDEKTAISWALVAIGVVCVWISAYNLFKRLGGPEEA